MMEDLQCGFMIFLKDKLLSLIIGEGEKKKKMYFPHLEIVNSKSELLIASCLHSQWILASAANFLRAFEEFKPSWIWTQQSAFNIYENNALCACWFRDNSVERILLEVFVRNAFPTKHKRLSNDPLVTEGLGQLQPQCDPFGCCQHQMCVRILLLYFPTCVC